MQNKENLTWYIVVLLVLVVVVGLLGVFKNNRTGEPRTDNKRVVKSPMVIPTAVMSEDGKVDLARVLAWIDSQKVNGGYYYWEEVYPFDGKVFKDMESPWAVFPVILARYEYWKKFEDRQQLLKIETDLADLLDIPDGNVVIQNNIWNCRTMAKLVKDPGIPESIKEKAKMICEIGLTRIKEIAPNSSVERFTGEYNPVFKNNYSNVFEGNWPKYVGDDLSETSFNIKASHVSDLVGHYQVSGEEKYVKYAKGAFEVALSMFSGLRHNDYVSGACTLAMAAIDLFKITGEDQYSDFYSALAEDQKINECGSENNRCRASLFNKSMCGLALLEASQYQPFQVNGVGEIKENIIKENYNNTNEDSSLSGIGNFYNKNIVVGDESDVYYNVRDNALSLILLINSQTKVGGGSD